MNASARRARTCVVSCAVLVLAAVGTASAQIPDKFTNLQMLPKDIGKGELVGTMRDFASALGQRCNYCHVGENLDSLEGYDFASDEPEHKRVARVMMQMVDEINRTLLPKIGKEPTHKVTCVTCHRGIKEPETMTDVLMEAIGEGGVAAAAKRYRELRDEYYGQGSYDFSGGPLNSVAESLVREGNDLDGAIEIAQLSVEFNPDAAFGHLMLGQLYSRKGDKDAALASIERALELEPDNKFAQQMLERVKSN